LSGLRDTFHEEWVGEVRRGETDRSSEDEAQQMTLFESGIFGRTDTLGTFLVREDLILKRGFSEMRLR
jgi:hypothetical protein